MTDLSDDEAVRHVQARLKALGHLQGCVDGAFGPLTQAALDAALPPPDNASQLPWIAAGLETLGWHETRDYARLRAWLKRDGKTLGDPDSLPWCGDWVETSTRIALPGEPLPGALGENCYWARNWLLWGRSVAPGVGTVLVFGRDGGGHVGFAIGQDDDELFVLGGNQSDRVCVSRLKKVRLLGARWPTTWPHDPKPLPRMSPENVPTSANEF